MQKFLKSQFLVDDLVYCFRFTNVYQCLITYNVLFDKWIGGWDMDAVSTDDLN